LILTGPTASGKSTLAVELALRLGAEIVSMDSMALYRGMDIGTAKPTLEERRLVPHHLIDVLEPWESATVAWWLERAKACVLEIEARSNRAMIVGGTPLYLRALLCGLFDGPGASEEIRSRLQKEAEAYGGQHLHDQLRQVDPVAAEKLHATDVRRVVRALEVWELTGRPISDWQRQWRRRDEGRGTRNKEGEQAPAISLSSLIPHPPSLVYCLALPREELYARINARVERMFAEGLVAEVERLRKLPRPISKVAAQALGYKEVLAYLEKSLSLDETIRGVQTRTRNFAKRQLTWFRSFRECRWLSRELTFASVALTIQD
jgi:tRNA dimethylallyltransferase